MFNARKLKELMTAQPFRPFKVRLSDGTSYIVPNHDAAFVTQNFLEVGLDLRRDGIARRSVNCAILHITQVEYLKAAVDAK
jgi:hypothetical protein